ncbi:MAG: DeoR family transcriptional regulator [Ruminococcus sp.]|nr:DeoR family transcriptional regulator [Ruminococcus sp.]
MYFKYIKRFVNDIDEAVSQDDLESAYNMRKIAEETLPKNTLDLAREEYQNSRKTIQSQSAWQIEGTLREFPKFKPIYCWFDYPIHKIDDTGILKDVTDNLNSKNSNWKKNFSNKKSTKKKAEDSQNSIEQSFTSLSTLNDSDTVTVKEMAESMGVSEKTVRRKIEKATGFSVDNGIISRDN